MMSIIVVALNGWQSGIPLQLASAEWRIRTSLTVENALIAFTMANVHRCVSLQKRGDYLTDMGVRF